ncbi:MAG: hypothetical protein JWM78_2053 [Verrucomicrobiaceae bacterium]|nr:hypothetical protein [Verrucomicrobiaceae bacterium]
MRTVSSIHRKRHPVTQMLGTSALALVLASSAITVSADDDTDPDNVISTGAPGVNGQSGKNGAAGKGVNAAVTSTNIYTSAYADFRTSATVTAGKGGNGGPSTAKVAAGNGAKGGDGKASVTMQNQIQQPNYPEITIHEDVSVRAGDGGDGGIGPVQGKGGAGGFANAKAVDRNVDQTYSEANHTEAEVVDVLSVSGVGGNGGAGRDGGAGGGSTSSSFAATTINTQSSSSAHGGSGGNALNQGGVGGNATADVSASAHSYNYWPEGAHATAIGGNGGTSATGLNGDGGRAVATVSGGATGPHGGDPVSLNAQAIGGNSGTGLGSGLASGKGGDASATVTAISREYFRWLGAAPIAIAQGGNGVTRGGNAISSATSSADDGGIATAKASGGGGKIAGAAIATASVNNREAFSPSVTATANFAGPFVKQVITSATSDPLPYDDLGDGFSNVSALYAQSRVGDTSGILAQAPQPPNSKYLSIQAAAPTSVEATQFLAGNSLSTTFAAGEVWGIGGFKSGMGSSGSFSATASYLFDTKAVKNPDDLWLGVLNTNYFGRFEFSVASGGNTVFDRSFTSADFNGNAIDLGDWDSLVGSDGLLKFDISFSQLSYSTDFAFGNAPAASAKAAALESSVPEPSALVLFCAGLIGLAISRKKSSAARLS